MRLPALFVASLLAASCGGTGAIRRTVPEPERLSEDQRAAYLAALTDLAEGRTAEALDGLEPLAALRPLHVPSHLLRQDAMRRAGRSGELPAEYAGLALEPESGADAEVLRLRVSEADPVARTAGYQAAAVKDASSPWPRVALALARSALARDLGRQASSRAMEGFVRESRALLEEAVATSARARTEAERAVAVAPGLAAAHGSLGHALATVLSLGVADDRVRLEIRGLALAACGRSLAIDPGDPAVLLERALLLLEARRLEEALLDLEAAARMAPRDGEILAARAQALEQSGESTRALDAYEGLLRVSPDWADAWVDAGSARLALGLLQDALKRYRRALELYRASGGETWKARRGIASTLAQMGLDGGDQVPFAEALQEVRAYLAEGGPDRAWAERMTWILAGDEAAEGDEPPTPVVEEGGR